MDIQLNKSKFGKNNGANAIAKRALLVAMLLGGGAMLLGQLNADEISKSNRVDLGESSVDSRKDSSDSAGKLQDSSVDSRKDSSDSAKDLQDSSANSSNSAESHSNSSDLAESHANSSNSAESHSNSSDLIDSAHNSDAVYIGESVITASGYEQDIKNAPASISIVPKEEIMTRPIQIGRAHV